MTVALSEIPFFKFLSQTEAVQEEITERTSLLILTLLIFIEHTYQLISFYSSLLFSLLFSFFSSFLSFFLLNKTQVI